jgi:uncharacterized membrane protein YphA (DoxX/SURF4 family)
MTSTAPALDPRASTEVATPVAAKKAAVASVREPAYQAYLVLRTAFVVAPILFGIDKFFNWMTFWPKYLWVGIPNVISLSPQDFMYAVGIVEIAAGVLVLMWPRVGSWVVAAWLAGIVTNLVIKSIAVGGHTQVFWDIALRDFGLMIAAIAFARLAAVFAPALPFGSRSR